MRRSTILGLLLAIPAVATAQSGNKKAERCEQPGATLAGRKAPSAKLLKLGDAPPANQYLAVLRSVDNCPEPVVLRKNIGGGR